MTNKLKQVLGGPAQLENIDNQIQENNLSVVMADCMQTKVKNMHNKEILNMEREFTKKHNQLKERMKNDMDSVF